MTDMNGFTASPVVLSRGADGAADAARAVRRAEVEPPVRAASGALPGASSLTAIRRTGSYLTTRLTGWAQETDGYSGGLAASGEEYAQSDSAGRSLLLDSVPPSTGPGQPR